MTVFVDVNTSKQDHIKVFANVDPAEKWFNTATSAARLVCMPARCSTSSIAADR
jgi:hypothetical protein